METLLLVVKTYLRRNETVRVCTPHKEGNIDLDVLSFIVGQVLHMQNLWSAQKYIALAYFFTKGYVSDFEDLPADHAHYATLSFSFLRCTDRDQYARNNIPSADELYRI